MKFKFTPVSQGLVCLLALMQGGAALAQQADAKDDTAKPKAQALEAVVITGIRAASERSLLMKRDASANVDVITAVDGERVHSGDELIGRTRAHRPGDRLELTIERGGKERKVSLVLGSSNSN